MATVLSILKSLPADFSRASIHIQVDIYMFLKEVHGTLFRIGYAQPLRLEDMMDEANAMINAKNPLQITLKDLLVRTLFHFLMFSSLCRYQRVPAHICVNN